MSSCCDLKNLIFHASNLHHMDAGRLELLAALILANELLRFQHTDIDLSDAMTSSMSGQYSVHAGHVSAET